MNENEFQEVARYPYRHATVMGGFVIPRKLVEDLEKHLASRTEAPTDNHTVYEVIDTWGEKRYFGFYDSVCRIGDKVDICTY